MNIRPFKEIINRFYFEKRIKFYFLIFMSMLALMFEYAGLILIFQFVLFLSNPDNKSCEGIVSFFKDNFHIFDFSTIALILGVSIASIYILKNIYMLVFVRFNNEILQDLSTKITTKIMRNLLFQDYLKVCKIKNEEKMNIISKVVFVVWQYCYKYINLIINSSMALILLIYLFAKFTLAALCASLFLCTLAFIEYKFLKKNSTWQNKHFSSCFGELNSMLLKTTSSIKEIKLNNMQQYFIDSIEEKCKNYAILNKNRSFCDTFHIYFTEISVMLSLIVILAVLFFTTNFDNKLIITTLTTICVIILRITPALNRAQSCLYAINSNESVARELLEFDDMFDKNFDFSTTKEKLPFEKSIEFKNVDFSYKQDSQGLKNINFKINKGEFVGIIAKSGGYKTTLSLLILGLLKPQAGEILIDNKILSEKNYKKWANNIALLSQDFSILFDEIDKNTKEYVEKLDIDSSLEISELSFGERQRMALANVLSKSDKDIFILDEITSSQDVILQDKINDILKDMKGQKTVIAISHRLHVLKDCNKIIYMEEGRIIDIGTFSSLSERYENFRKIVELSNFSVD